MKSPPANRRFPTASLALAALVLVPWGPTAGASHDGDDLPDEYEPLVCGHPLLYDAVNSLPPGVARCPSPDDLHAPALDGPPCAACQSLVIYDDRVELTDAFDVDSLETDPVTVEVPPTDVVVPIVRVDTGPDQEGKYCVFVQVLLVEDPGTRWCSLALAPIRTVLDDLTPIDLVAIPQGSLYRDVYDPPDTPAIHVPATAFDVTVTMFWDDFRLLEHNSVDVGLMGVSASDCMPVNLLDPTGQEILWWLHSSGDTRLELTLDVLCSSLKLSSLSALRCF